MEDDWPTTYKIICTKHDEAYQKIDKAIKNEENENPQLALTNYKLSIVLIDEALSTPVAVPDDLDSIDDTFGEACKMIHKMKRTRGEVIQRVATLSIKYPTPANQPDDDQPIASSSSSVDQQNQDQGPAAKRPRTFTELAQELRNLESTEMTDHTTGRTELIFQCENAKLYHIQPNGDVSTASESSILRVVSLEGDENRNLDTTFFLQIILKSEATEVQIATVGKDKNDENIEQTSKEHNFEAIRHQSVDLEDNSWIYPLVPGVAPCFLTSYGAFIFPDLQSEVHGAAYGITVVGDAQEILLQILEALLHGVAKEGKFKSADQKSPHHRRHRHRSRRDTSQRVSDNIVKGAYYISNNLVRGSTKMGELVSYGTPYVLSKLGAPHASSSLPPAVLTGVEVAKTATGAAAGITGYVAGKVGSATSALGRFLAPHVQTQGSRLLSSTMGYTSDEATEKVKGVLTVTAGAVEGFGTVYSGLEDSAAILGRSIGDNSVKIIQHKYGETAGTAAAGTFDTVGNMINLSKHMGYMTPKGLVKKSAKNAGKGLIDGFKTRPTGSVNYVMAGSLCPDLSEFSKAVSKSQQS